MNETVRRFNFPETFATDTAPTPASAASARPAPARPQTFTPEQLESLLANARREGAIEGEATARAAIEHRLAENTQNLSGQLSRVAETILGAEKQFNAAVVELALTIARKMLPALIEREGTKEAEAMLRHALSELVSTPRLVVRVHESMLDALREKIDALKTEQGYNGAIVLLTDPAMDTGDCRIEWADGGQERSLAALWHGIDKAVARIHAGNLFPATTAIPTTTVIAI